MAHPAPITHRLPTNEALLNQSVSFHPHWWTRHLPPGWGDVLESLPASSACADPAKQRAGAPGYRTISRRDVLRIGAQGHSHAALVAALAWWTGSRSHLVARRARFAAADELQVADRLADAHSTLRCDGPAAAFEQLVSPAGHVKYLGPVLASVLLYALDAPGKGHCGRALILDGYMMLALASEEAWPFEPRAAITPDIYQAWLELATSMARRATRQSGTLVRIDAIESALFAAGVSIASQQPMAA